MCIDQKEHGTQLFSFRQPSRSACRVTVHSCLLMSQNTSNEGGEGGGMEVSVKRLDEHLQDIILDVLGQWTVKQLKLEYTNFTCGRTHV